jgi:molybdopterin/thiamine biosynthesis adenylyltransferase
MPKWFETDEARFQEERARMEPLGFVLDDGALKEGRVEFKGTINDSVSDVAIRVICEDGFPFRIPLFQAPKLALTPQTKHIAFRTRLICLRTAKPQGWKNTERIADLIPDAQRILRAQHTGDFGEEHLAPDQDLFAMGSFKEHVVIPTDLSIPPQEAFFKLNASECFAGRVLFAHRIGDISTKVRIAVGREEKTIIVFRLKEMPLGTISANQPDFRHMLERYASNSGIALNRLGALGNTSKHGYFGIVFDYNQEPFWQFFRVDRITKQSKSIIPIRTVKLDQLSARINGIVDVDRLRAKTVLVAGCGGIGSTIAVELACAGVGRLFLNDSDSISIANVIRHECSLVNLGDKKPDALKVRINIKNPLTSVETGPDIFTDSEFEDKLSKSNLIVCAIGDYNIEEYVNRLCVKHGKPAIFAYIGLYGSMGHVLRIDPNEHETGCFACFQRQIEAGVIPNLPIIEDLNAVVVEVGCNNPSLPAASFDQKTVALIAVRKAIQNLDPWSYDDDVNDAIVFYARHMEGIIEEQSLRTEKFRVPALEDCLICGAAAQL